MKSICENCRFWKPPAEEPGECHCHSPFIEGFPICAADDWCGEFAQKRVEVEPKAKPKANPINVQCVYLGKPTGEKRGCETCRGKVELIVYECLCPSHAEYPTTTRKDCQACKDYVRMKNKPLEVLPQGGK